MVLFAGCMGRGYCGFMHCARYYRYILYLLLWAMYLKSEWLSGTTGLYVWNQRNSAFRFPLSWLLKPSETEPCITSSSSCKSSAICKNSSNCWSNSTSVTELYLFLVIELATLSSCATSTGFLSRILVVISSKIRNFASYAARSASVSLRYLVVSTTIDPKRRVRTIDLTTGVARRSLNRGLLRGWTEYALRRVGCNARNIVIEDGTGWDKW